MKTFKTLVWSAGICLLWIAALSAEPAHSGILSVQITPGENWKQKRSPQMAVWVETEDGAYLETLFATRRAGEKSWFGRPKGGRPESLPVWYHASNQAATVGTRKQTDSRIDAVTSATPKKSIMIPEVSLPSGVYTIKVEVNHSFDYNDSWPKKAQKGTPEYSGVNGQPSVIYSGTLDTASGKPYTEIILQIAGTGSVDGADGQIHNERSKLTTATTILDSVRATWKQK